MFRLSKFQKLRLFNLIIQSLYIVALTALLGINLFCTPDQPHDFPHDRATLIFLIFDIFLYASEITIASIEIKQNRIFLDNIAKIYHASTGPVSIGLYVTSYALAWTLNREIFSKFTIAICLIVPLFYAILYLFDQILDLTGHFLSPDPFIKPARPRYKKPDRRHQIH